MQLPRDRARQVTIELLSDKTLPNILLGAFLTALIQYTVGMVPLGFLIASMIAWLTSIGVYAWVDQVQQAIEEAKRKTLDDDPAPKGIE